jgi:4-hydroxy-3-methylbut-2-en-1-yl diphosphate synthase IspG/GcpE
VEKLRDRRLVVAQILIKSLAHVHARLLQLDTAVPLVVAIHHIPTQLMLHELDRRLLDEVVSV